MKPKVMIGPAQLKGIEPVYAPMLEAAGFELVFPKRNIQMVEAEVLEQVPGCTASLAGSEPYTRAVIAKAAAAGLKLIARAGVGYDAVDVAAATEFGVAVTNAPGTNHDAVGEHTLLLMLALTKNFVPQNEQIKAGGWPRKPTLSLRTRTLGIIGLGRTGKSVCQRAQAFGMKVIATDPYADPAFAQTHGVTMLPLDELLRSSDYVTLHVPLTTETKYIINARAIGLMKPTSFLINASRGGVIQETDLAEALQANRIAGAALDVLEQEPPPANLPLLQQKNAIFTAHTAGIDSQSRDDMARVAAEAIVKLFRGEWPTDLLINPEIAPRWKP